MKYVEDDQGIKKFFAAFHLHKTFPAAVIVDDFGDFFDDSNCQAKYSNQRGRDLAIVRTLALCRDAITHANERLASRPPCKLLLSDTQHGDTPRLFFIYKRWVPSIFTIKGDGMQSFLLKNNTSTSVGESGSKEVAKYSIALQYLVLEDIVDEE
ncbi:tRNA dimethylallyltransferase [Thalictrum thalictroides]|uniref:tRNA dimethylallyltransferase n=1 Tax=Thalictrum thalictroides TaxID=46969 RepID=A0A7J6VQG5_THATH|nr:tRNA dimethylallyltransferase [Thalictrum thalictroides]